MMNNYFHHELDPTSVTNNLNTTNNNNSEQSIPTVPATSVRDVDQLNHHIMMMSPQDLQRFSYASPHPTFFDAAPHQFNSHPLVSASAMPTGLTLPIATTTATTATATAELDPSIISFYTAIEPSTSIPATFKPTHPHATFKLTHPQLAVSKGPHPNLPSPNLTPSTTPSNNASTTVSAPSALALPPPSSSNNSNKNSVSSGAGAGTDAATLANGSTKKRYRPNKQQLKVLIEAFKQNAIPDAYVKHDLARQLGMPPRSVQIW
jgi:hypothetical protein